MADRIDQELIRSNRKGKDPQLRFFCPGELMPRPPRDREGPLTLKVVRESKKVECRVPAFDAKRFSHERVTVKALPRLRLICPPRILDQRSTKLWGNPLQMGRVSLQLGCHWVVDNFPNTCPCRRLPLEIFAASPLALRPLMQVFEEAGGRS
jgi:hypothetical protein